MAERLRVIRAFVIGPGSQKGKGPQRVLRPLPFALETFDGQAI